MYAFKIEEKLFPTFPLTIMPRMGRRGGREGGGVSEDSLLFESPVTFFILSSLT